LEAIIDSRGRAITTSARSMARIDWKPPASLAIAIAARAVGLPRKRVIVSMIARCGEYNARIRTLHELAGRVAELVRRRRIALDAGSPLAYAHRELARLDELIAYRQAITMGYGVVRLATLDRECEFFARVDAHVGPIIVAAERAATRAQGAARGALLGRRRQRSA
jgi:hypothetical protein